MEEAVMTAPVLQLEAPDLEGVLEEFEAYHAIYSPLFKRREQGEWAEEYLRGLLLDLPRKSIEPMVLALRGGKDTGAIRAMQQFLSEGTWDEERVLKQHSLEVDRTLGDEDGTLILDGSDFAKQGTHSVGVKRQYCGELGKTANCQAAVFLGYASVHGYTLLDKRLYMPQEWLEDGRYAERRTKCRVPEKLEFRTKPQLGAEMLRHVSEQGTLRRRWLTCDEAFGRDTALLEAAAHLGLWYFAEVPHDTRLYPDFAASGQSTARAEGPKSAFAIVEELSDEHWSRFTVKEGAQGPLVADFAFLRCSAVRRGKRGPQVWLVLRLNPFSGELKTFLSNAPAEIAPASLVRQSAMRWPIEMCFEDGKGLLGMGDYEVRTFRGWHHHMTLCILAHFFLVRLQINLKKSPSPDTASGTPDPRIHAAKADVHGLRCS